MPRSFVVPVVLAVLALSGAGGCLFSARGIGGPYTVGDMTTARGCAVPDDTAARAVRVGTWFAVDVDVHTSATPAAPLANQAVRLSVEVQDAQQNWVPTSPADTLVVQQPAATGAVGTAQAGLTSGVVSAPSTAGRFRIRGFVTPPGMAELEVTELDCSAVVDVAATALFQERHVDVGPALGVAVGYADADAYLDVAVIGSEPATGLSYFVGGPDRFSHSPWTAALSGMPSAVAIGNFGGATGGASIAVAHAASGGPSLALFGFNGSGTGLVAKPERPLTAAASALCAADLDGSGDVCAIAAEPTATAGPLELIDLADPTAITNGGLATATALASGRFDGDTLDDVVATGPDGTVTVYLGSTQRLASPATVQAELGSPAVAVAFGDLNSDSLEDVVVAMADGTLIVLLQVASTSGGLPTLTAQPAVTLGGTPTALGIGDFNGDGAQDVAVTTHANGHGQLEILLSFNGGLVATPVHPVAGSPRSLAVGDLDRDGRDDVVVVSPGQPLVIFFGL